MKTFFLLKLLLFFILFVFKILIIYNICENIYIYTIFFFNFLIIKKKINNKFINFI
jgi:hypothetical protein